MIRGVAASFIDCSIMIQAADNPTTRALDAASTASAVRSSGPSLVEAKTYRFYNHHGIQNLGLKYRPDDEVLAWKERDPIFSFEDRMVKSGRLTRDQIEASWAGVRADIEAAIEFAENSPFPEPEALMQGVYSEVQS